MRQIMGGGYVDTVLVATQPFRSFGDTPRVFSPAVVGYIGCEIYPMTFF
jgi:hypothetical protein